MEIKRDLYLKRLVDRMHNGMIKVVTGVRRCGKSYLLFKLFYDYLRQNGVKDNHIIRLALDDRMNKQYRDPDALCNFVRKQIKDEQQYYVLLDEVQFVPEFEDVLNSFLHAPTATRTASNSAFRLSRVMSVPTLTLFFISTPSLAMDATSAARTALGRRYSGMP